MIVIQRPFKPECAQVAVANLLGLPLSRVRQVFDELGYKAFGRIEVTPPEATARVLSVLTRKPWKIVRHLSDAGRSYGIASNGQHAVAFCDDIVQDGARFYSLWEFRPCRFYVPEDL